MPEFYDDIYEYLDKNEGRTSVSSKNLDDVVYKICAHTGFDFERSSIILEAILNEIRSNMLKGNKVNLKGFGSFFIASPKTKTTKNKIFPKFKAHKSLIIGLNDDR